jgi:hypothetical protein
MWLNQSTVSRKARGTTVTRLRIEFARGLSNTTRTSCYIHRLHNLTTFNHHHSTTSIHFYQINFLRKAERQKMTKPRKYKPKPPISQLNDTAAQHRRTQSCKAQRAYRQRKEDTIATLTTQISDLEITIERLSVCFLGLNDRVLGYLRRVEEGKGGVLAEGIRDAMEEFKGIIEGGDGREMKVKRGVKEVRLETNEIQKASPSRHYPSPTASLSYEIPLQQPSSNQLLPQTLFSGPAIFGLTPTTLLHHTPSTSTQNHHDLAHRLYNSTIEKAYSIVYTPGPPTALFRRIYATYFNGESDEQVKQKVMTMMDQRVIWSYLDKVSGSELGWWSALQVAGFVASQGGWFDKARDVLVVRGGKGEVEVEGLLDGELQCKNWRS